ncbi:MAG: hypothetical protein SNI12_08720 [Rikenellaceae bacterium]
MKRYIVMMAVAMAAICTSCSKDDEVAQVTPPTTETKGQEIKINFTTDAATRAFFGETATAESWEKSISKATLVIDRYTDASQPAVESVKQELTADQITSGSVSASISTLNVGDFISAAVVTNIDVPSGIAATNVYSSVVSNMDYTEYNGTFQEVSSSSKREDGFIHHGNGFAIVENIGEVQMAITLTRHVAKVAIQTTLSDKFNNSSYYAGDLRIDNIEACCTNLYDPFFENCFSFTQASNKSGVYYQNLFYLQQSSRNKFIISATYDADGNYSTTADQFSTSYTFEIANDNGSIKELLPNAYYRVSVTINSIELNDIDFSITVAEWDTVVNQSVEIG